MPLAFILLGLLGWMIFSQKFARLLPQLLYLIIISLLAVWGIHSKIFVFDFQAFQKDSFVLNFLKMLPGFVILILAMGLFRYHKFGSFPKPGEKFWLVMMLYPFFGFFQQVVVLAFLYPNFLTMTSPLWATILTALFFSLAHFPNRTLTPIAFFGQLATIILYRFFFPNIFVLSLYHGIIGTCLFYLILQDNVWQRKVK